jgi:hypothetical protein
LQHPKFHVIIKNIETKEANTRANKLTRGTLKYSKAKEVADIIGRKVEWSLSAPAASAEE